MLHKLPFNTHRSKPINEVRRWVTFAFPSSSPFRHRLRPSDFPRVCPNVNAILPIFSGVTDQEASALLSPHRGDGQVTGCRGCVVFAGS